MVILSSCYKSDFHIDFTDTTGLISLENNISMGVDYTDQVFYDLESKEKYVSSVKGWDMSFYGDIAQPHLKMNTGEGWSVYKTTLTDMSSYINVNSIAYDQWRIDNPNGDISDLAFGDFSNPAALCNIVFILRHSLNNGQMEYFKLKFLSFSAYSYKFEFKPLNRNYSTEYTASIPNNLPTKYYYAKLNSVGELDTLNQKIEAVKSMNWDFVFTRYSKYFLSDNLNYIVSGVLLNQNNTSVYLDSLSDFQTLNLNNIDLSRLEYTQDGIGYNWKSIDNTYALYTIKENYIYIIKTQEGSIYKLRFLSFYNSKKEKGNPSFEFQKLN